MGKYIYRGIKYLVFSIVVLILVLSIIFLFKNLVLKQEPTSMFGYTSFQVASGSMEPDMSVGDLVVVKKRDSNYYQEGMDITYITEAMKTPVTHRIITRDGDTITAQGIANNTPDAPFDVECIIGEVVYVWEEYYKFSEFVKSPLGIIIILLGGYLVIETFSLLDKKILKKEVSKEK